MAAQNDEWRTTCISAYADADGTMFALVVLSDSESFYSIIYRVTDFDAGDDDNIYEVQAWLTDFWLSPDGRLYAVDADGKLHSNEAGRWEITDLECPNGFTWIWGFDKNRLFACGRAGTIVRRIGGAWERFDTDVDGDLYGLHGTATDDLYMVGEEGRVFHFDGAGWQRLPSPTNYNLNSVCCKSNEKIYICGEGGMLFEGNTTGWTRISGLEIDLYALAVYKEALFIGAGTEGVYRYDGTEVDLVKDNIIAYGLTSSDQYLCAAGGDEAARFDGTVWDARGWA